MLAALVLWQDNSQKLFHILAQFDRNYIATLLLIELGLNGISSVKWSLFIHERGIQISQLRLFKLYLIGKFFNNFLPSMVGGDVARIYLLGQLMNSHSRSFASVFLERATGVVGLTLLAAGFALANPEILSNRTYTPGHHRRGLWLRGRPRPFLLSLRFIGRGRSVR